MRPSLLPVKPISQLAPKPMIMGCEGVAAAMILQYNHHSIPASDLMKQWPTHPDNPEIGYVGHPLMIKPGVHQTIFPSALVPYLQQFDSAIIDGSGQPLSYLETVLDGGQPVMLYHTHLGVPPMRRRFKTSSGLKHWVSNIHVTVLIGYDDRYYYFIDPLWMQFHQLLLPALWPSKRQIHRMRKQRLTKSYDAPGRMCLYKQS
ncbi:C39 family peptidase [Macrococcus equipercicus]|uniref:C39 family peptidase n=1 Tax=Macrococcus equipercicus TaxID=69967 RepID=A0A9Q9BQZ1_9STAP|nr:C39 family peptidase [Macrococcus equipercicus]UTH13909.1 C39 family peptidase [Macrococcus equipercicus]